jgi:transcriptional regulator with XRE-family HTH domain/tetratricopeptide (TPR) repeat protein
MPRVFISYRRAPSAMLAQMIYRELVKRGIDVFMDTETMQGVGAFPDLLRREIQRADVFVCLLAPTTLDSPWVLEEIRTASEQGKTLIPVMQQDFVEPAEPEAPVAALLRSNGVPVLDRQNLYVSEALDRLALMITGKDKRKPTGRLEEVSFGDWVRDRRKTLGLTQAQLAAALDTSAGVISKIESGERRPTLKQAESLATTLRIAAKDRARFIRAGTSAQPAAARPAEKRPAAKQSTPSPRPEPARSTGPLSQAAVEPTDAHASQRYAPKAIVADSRKIGLLAVERSPELIGRDDVLARVQALLDDGKHVLLQGFGGVGKTALAAEIAAGRIKAGKGAVIWLRIGNDSAEAALEALSAPLKDAGQADDSLADLLDKKQIGLITLDDVWNGKTLKLVLDAVRPAGLPVLITSRLRFPLNNGEIVQVGALSPQGALTLLNYYAHAHYSAEDRDAIELCSLLGGHPFGLEIAGKTLWMQEIAPGELLTRNRQSVAMMKVPRDFAEAGRESVAALIETSLNFLEPTTRDLFAAFGTLFTPHTTVALLSRYRNVSPDKVQDALGELQNSALIERIPPSDDSAPFFRMHDLAYSYAQSVAGHTAATHKRRAVQALIKACHAYLGEFTGDLNALQAERENLFSAAAAAAESGDHQHLIEIMFGLSVSSGFMEARGHTVQTIELLRRAIAAAIGEQAHVQAHYMLSKLGNIYLNYLADYDSALQAYQQALELAQAINDKTRQAMLLSIIGITRFQQKAADAETYLEMAYRLATDNQDDRALGLILQHLSHKAANSQPPDWEAGRRFADEAVALAIRLNWPDSQFAGLLNRGSCEMELKQYDAAVASHQAAHDLAARSGNQDGLAVALRCLGEDFHHQGDEQKAQANFSKALKMFDQLGDSASKRELLEFMEQAGYGRKKVES